MSTGSCLCGRVRFEIDGELTAPGYCHCASCRKSTGSAFAAGALARARDLRWLAGLDAVASHARPDDDLHHYFCRECGASLMTAPEGASDPAGLGDGRVGVHLGCLDGHPPLRPGRHLHVAQKAPWYDILDELPRYRALPES